LTMETIYGRSVEILTMETQLFLGRVTDILIEKVRR
jgi:hypothetical protein